MVRPMTIQERLAVQQKYRFRVEDYLLLAESGAFDDYARTELIEGEILAVNAIQTRHAQMQANLHLLIGIALSSIQSTLRTYLAPSIKMDGESMPEPDIVIGEASTDKYLPFTKIRLVVEISDTTLDCDLGRKVALYARQGIPEYWVADVNARVIHQMWAPEGEAYAQQREMVFGGSVAAATIEGLAVATAGI